jgi:tetratricopeptide (TPR) repeat protein
MLVLALTATARAAEPSNEDSRAHVRKATVAYNLGKFTEAAKEYEAAYELTVDPNMLFNIAQSYRLAGESEKAITAYRSFIRSAPKSDQRGLAEAKVRELEQQRAARPPAPVAPVPVPPSPPALPAASPPLAAPPPVPVASPTAPAASAPADATPANVLVSTPAPEPAPAPESHFYTRWPFWTAVGVVVAGGVALGVVLASRGDGLSMPPTDFGTKRF